MNLQDRAYDLIQNHDLSDEEKVIILYLGGTEDRAPDMPRTDERLAELLRNDPINTIERTMDLARRGFIEKHEGAWRLSRPSQP